MAMANIEIKCTVCGETFRHRKECRNAADRTQYELWAAEHIDTCPVCYKKQQDAIAASKLDAKLAELGIQLPNIIGVSEKQIAYAESIRRKTLIYHMDRIEKYIKVSQRINTPEIMEKFRAECAKEGIDPDIKLKKMLAESRLDIIKVMLEETNAKTIIEFGR